MKVASRVFRKCQACPVIKLGLVMCTRRTLAPLPAWPDVTPGGEPIPISAVTAYSL